MIDAAVEAPGDGPVRTRHHLGAELQDAASEYAAQIVNRAMRHQFCAGPFAAFGAGLLMATLGALASRPGGR